MLVQILINFNDLPCDWSSLKSGDFIVLSHNKTYSLNQKPNKFKQLFIAFDFNYDNYGNVIALPKGTMFKLKRIYTKNGTFVLDCA